ncbi:glycosyltransferase [Actinocorallia longicatena]|uniref:Glycosyl transferase family 28 C-terminal domain-containing protein n=1 Tax=Actinocorallia longicatena TaxID=111803 RepID=A0ABP6Q542_9ACTN
MNPLVFVTVGTDHHPFHRMIDWMEPWAAAHPDVRCVVQHGTSRAPAFGECHPLISHDRVAELMSTAAAVVCHGGPGTVAAAREAGRLPIVVPRRSGLGEHVDDHQVRFTTLMAERGLILRPDTAEDLHARLDTALATPGAHTVTAEGVRTDEVAERFGLLVEELMARPRRRGWRRPAG